MRDPGRLVSLTAKRNGREVWRIRLDEEPVCRNESKQIVIRPFPEGHDPAEGDIPAGVERQLCERVRSGVAMQDSRHLQAASRADQGAGVVLGISGVHNHGKGELCGELDLGEEGRALGSTRGIVVVIIEPALSDSDRVGGEDFSQLGKIPNWVKRRGVVWMDSGRREHESLILCRAISGYPGCRQGLTDADDRRRARIAGAGYYRAAVAGERRVREVGVAVDEDRRVSVLRGHFRSIQRSTGAAT